MDVNKLNKRRVFINILSLVITILLLAIFIFLEIIINSLSNPLYSICFSIILFMSFALLLFIEAKLIIIPLYEKIKLEIAKTVFKQRYDNANLKIVNPNKLYEYFYNKSMINIMNSFEIQLENITIKTFDFTNVKKRRNKGQIKEFYGKYVYFTINGLNASKMAFVSQNKDMSDKFNNYFSNKYSKINNEVTSLKKYNRYNCYYDDNFDIKYLTPLENISLFNAIIFDNNNITLFFHEKNEGYEFNLTKKINNDIFALAKSSYSLLFKLIDEFKEKNNV